MPPVELVTDPDRYAAYLYENMQASQVPGGLHEGLFRYLVDHIPTGSFLLAVLSNDLAEACARADVHVRYRLFDVVFFLTNYAPAAAWGSHERVRAWLENRPRPK